MSSRVIDIGPSRSRKQLRVLFQKANRAEHTLGFIHMSLVDRKINLRIPILAHLADNALSSRQIHSSMMTFLDDGKQYKSFFASQFWGFLKEGRKIGDRHLGFRYSKGTPIPKSLKGRKGPRATRDVPAMLPAPSSINPTGNDQITCACSSANRRPLPDMGAADEIFFFWGAMRDEDDDKKREGKETAQEEEDGENAETWEREIRRSPDKDKDGENAE